MRGSLGTIVPPSRVPEALEEALRVAVKEVEVPSNCLIEKRERSDNRVVRKGPMGGRGEVGSQLEDEARLGLGFKEEKVQQQVRKLVPPFVLDQVPRAEPEGIEPPVAFVPRPAAGSNRPAAAGSRGRSTAVLTRRKSANDSW